MAVAGRISRRNFMGARAWCLLRCILPRATKRGTCLTGLSIFFPKSDPFVHDKGLDPSLVEHSYSLSSCGLIGLIQHKVPGSKGLLSDVLIVIVPFKPTKEQVGEPLPIFVWLLQRSSLACLRYFCWLLHHAHLFEDNLVMAIQIHPNVILNDL
ncbi:uncharacterized protein LOC110031582 [Phalaenopsis equestris]|uniref:uncharacterized protein LOC110031582 n=1 Tax=Phalaenopsis equestris TaxID=78828 RepID=UPI0009E497B6|nr:uncharacterized protein LOC110031582 [Phalaenopsis equestris]